MICRPALDTNFTISYAAQGSKYWENPKLCVCVGGGGGGGDYLMFY